MLFGFRVYPIAPLIAVMAESPWMRRFDFDPEAAVRLVWRGVRPVNLPAPVRYLRPEEGGVSHFHYGRDNALLTWMHLRLLAGAFARLPPSCGGAELHRRRRQLGTEIAERDRPPPAQDQVQPLRVSPRFHHRKKLDAQPWPGRRRNGSSVSKS